MSVLQAFYTVYGCKAYEVNRPFTLVCLCQQGVAGDKELKVLKYKISEEMKEDID